MSKFEEYANKYKNVKMERQDGILQLTLHRNNGPVVWDFELHHETTHALGDMRAIATTGRLFSPLRATNLLPSTSSVTRINFPRWFSTR
jgi:hypothetical protein